MLGKRKEHAPVCSRIYTPGKKTKIDTAEIKILIKNVVTLSG